ncbi:MAG: citrate lyase holo-[acyl-carrier protein] synthase [Synergistaceae bacterium]
MNTNNTDIRDALNDILIGREERVKIRNKHLSENIFACQVTLNIPGYPKRMPNDEKAVENLGRAFIDKWTHLPQLEKKITNAAGAGWVGFFKGDHAAAKKAKETAVNIEEKNSEGRIFDIDIIVPKKTITRSDLGLPPRTCLLCDRPAKECARDRRHSYEELRAVIEKLIKNI